jgi:hypothetical protein
MKKLLLTLVSLSTTLSTLYSQNIEDTLIFHLAPESVTVYGSTSDTKGFTLIDEFDDHYSLKLTNKLYKVNLFFDMDKKVALKNIIIRILGNEESRDDQKKMIWIKTNINKKPIYTIELAELKLKIKIYRKKIDASTYATLNQLGNEILKEINK